MVNRLEQLMEALTILSSEFNVQISYLIDIGHFQYGKSIADSTNIDELYLQFEDTDYLTERLFRSGLISKDAELAISNLRNAIIHLSQFDDQDFWTVYALRCDPRWFTVRELASTALLRMQESPNETTMTGAKTP